MPPGMDSPNPVPQDLTINPSLWMATSEWPERPVLRGDMTVQAVVIGAGITGLTAARLLCEQGLTVAVIESRRVCSGVTGLTTAKVTALQSTIYTELSQRWGDETSAAYAAANLEGLEMIRGRAQAEHIDCDMRTAPALTYAETAHGLAKIEAEVEAAQRAGLSVSFTTESDLPFEIAGAVRLENQAQFHPRNYCLGLVRGILADGGAIFEETRAIDLDATAGNVVTDRGTVSAEVIVVASHIPFVDTSGYFARMTPSRSYAVAFRSPGEPPSGMYISVDQPIRSIRSTGDGYTIVGGEAHPAGEKVDTEDRYRALASWSQDRFRVSDVDYRWSAQDYRSVDGLPFVGPLGSSGRVFSATGFAKWGMSNGTVAAAIMVDLAMGRDNSLASVFDSRRFALKQAAPGLLKAGAGFAKSLLMGRVLPSDRRGLEHVDRGSGDVVSIDGHKAAAFRDDDGGIHAVSPICTHRGCQVQFNNAERTWDCPCHGSRFDVEGKVIHGPAVRDLAPLDEKAMPRSSSG